MSNPVETVYMMSVFSTEDVLVEAGERLAGTIHSCQGQILLTVAVRLGGV